MSRFYVLKTGQTVFETQDRIESAGGSALTDEGAAAVRQAAVEIAGKDIDVIYCSEGEAEHQSAKEAGKLLHLKVRIAPDLHELDYGLWQGLTLSEIRRRQPKVHRQWIEAPMTVCPPGGETLADAQQRICKTLKGIVKRHKDETPLVVLRPVAMGLLRCALDQKDTETIWQQIDGDLVWCSYEMNLEALAAVSG